MKVRLVGLTGVAKTLRELPKELKAGRIVRNAVRRGAVIIRDEAKSNVRRIVLEPNKGDLPTESTGALEAAINIKNRSPDSGKNGEAASVGIGKISAKVRTALKIVGDPRYYAWWLEFGTERMKAHPFMRPAYESKRMDALMEIHDSLIKGVDRALRKLKKMNRVRE